MILEMVSTHQKVCGKDNTERHVEVWIEEILNLLKVRGVITKNIFYRNYIIIDMSKTGNNSSIKREICHYADNYCLEKIMTISSIVIYC